MGTFFVYILKAAICLALFYLFYRLLLSRETFHRFNRVALLGILLLSLLIPLIEISIAEQTEVHQTMLTWEQILLMADNAPATAVVPTSAEKTNVPWIQLALLLYLAGIVFFACRHIYSLVRLLILVRSGRREKREHGTVVVVHPKEIAPFSWMKYIVISEKDLGENSREILIHEEAHIRNRHSVDLLMAEICIFFQWFNPAAWLLKQELQNIHEYEADETVIREGVNAKQYQLLLIKKAVGTRLYSMANSFNHSSLKKRITMMLKEKSNPWARLKYLYVLPLAAIAVAAFARPEVSGKAEEISAVKVNDLAAIVETKVQETVELQKGTTHPPVDYSSLITSSNNPKAGDINHRISVEMKIVDEKGKPVEREAVLVVPFSTNTGALSGYGGEVKLTGIPAGNLLRVFYGGAAGRGVSVEAKPKLTVALPSDRKPGKTVSKQPEIVRDTTLTIRIATSEKPLLIVDGEEVNTSIESIPLDRVEAFTVLKDSEAISVYGDRGKSGVILVTMKKKAKTQQEKREIIGVGSKSIIRGVHSLHGKDLVDVAYYVDGRKLTAEEVKQLDQQNMISSVSVVKDSVSGSAIHITTKGTDLKMNENEMKVSGKVQDEDGKPIIGASVVIKGTTSGTISDADGTFVLTSPKDAILVVSYILMSTETVKVSSNPIFVTLKDK